MAASSLWNREALDLIDDDSTSWENEPLTRLSEQDQLAVYRHHGYWQNMDTLRGQNGPAGAVGHWKTTLARVGQRTCDLSET